MSFDHEQITLPNYILFECRGEFSVAGMMQKLLVAFDAAAETNRDAVLIDLRAVEGPTPDKLQRYEMGAEVARVQRDRGIFIRLAVVGREPMIDPERFAEVVSHNRGASARGFTDIVDAIAWLEEASSVERPKP